MSTVFNLLVAPVLYIASRGLDRLRISGPFVTAEEDLSKSKRDLSE